MCGACPIPAGSGKTNGRHRLNRGGNRQANAALYRAVIVRLRWHQPTIDYTARRTAEGLSKRKIIRGLKRYLAREIYHLLPPVDLASSTHPAPTQHPPRQPPEALDIYRSFNAVSESLFASYTRELIHTRTWPCLKDLKKATFDWIETYYNRQRRHSTLGYLTPHEHELGYRDINQLAA